MRSQGNIISRLFLVLVLAFTYILPRAGFLVGGIALPLTIGYILISVFIVKFLLTPYGIGVKTPINGIFFLYLCLVAISSIYGLASGGNRLVILFHIFTYFFACISYFAMAKELASENKLSLFMKLFILSAFLVPLYGILVHYTGYSSLVRGLTYTSASDLAMSYLWVEEGRRTLSSYGDPNVLIAQLIVFFSVLLSLYSNGRLSPMGKAVILSGVILNLACIILTRSRIALFTVPLTLILVGLKSRKGRFLTATIILVIGLSQQYQDVERLYERSDFSEDIRGSYVQVASRLVLNFTGSGFGNAMHPAGGSKFRIYAARADGVWDGFNSFHIQLLSLMGVPGYAAFIFMLYKLFRYLVKGIGGVADDNQKAFLIGGTAGLITLQLVWLANNTYMLPGGLFNFWLLAGGLTAIAKRHEEK